MLFSLSMSVFPCEVHESFSHGGDLGQRFYFVAGTSELFKPRLESLADHGPDAGYLRVGLLDKADRTESSLAVGQKIVDQKHPVSGAELRGIVEREAFGESLLSIEPAIRTILHI